MAVCLVFFGERIGMVEETAGMNLRNFANSSNFVATWKSKSFAKKFCSFQIVHLYIKLAYNLH